MANNEGEVDKKSEKMEPEVANGGQYLLGLIDGTSSAGSNEEEVYCNTPSLMTAVVDRSNMLRALKRVERNKGVAGIDSMSVDQLRPWLTQHWAMIKAKLLEGSYQPQAVERVEIPKPDGGVRILGIPTVLDRLIQQAIAQVLNPIFEPHFCDESYGFRPKRNAVQAVRKAQEYQHEGRRWVVDLDMEKFFDVVNHDILMQCLREQVDDFVLLALIGRYLRAGMMNNGIESQRTQGTPQGGPLSPLLSNILLNRFDKELKEREHSFVRYADDCNIYVRSKRAAERVLKSVTRWLEERLKLRVNRCKSAVGRPWKRKFLGYSVTNHKKTKLRVAQESVKRFKAKVKATIRQGKGRNIERYIRESLNPIFRGWVTYFRAIETKSTLKVLDGWIRRRLRNILWRQWKRPRTRRKKLMKLGLHESIASKSAYNGRGAWFNSGANFMNVAVRKKYFDRIGLVNLQSEAKFIEQIALL